MFHNTADQRSARSKNASPARQTTASQNVSQYRNEIMDAGQISHLQEP